MGNLVATAALCLAFATLLEFVDTVAESAAYAPTRSNSSTASRSGNNGTLPTIISLCCELLSQLVLGYVADTKGRKLAMYLNCTGIFVHSIWIYFAELHAPGISVEPSLIGAFFRLIGGSSHASRMLALIVLNDIAPAHQQTSLFSFLGALSFVVQLCSPPAATSLSSAKIAVAIILAVLFSALSFATIALLPETTNWEGTSAIWLDPSSRPLLASLMRQDAGPTFPGDDTQRRQGESDTQTGLSDTRFFAGRLLADWNSRLSLCIFFLASISKSSRKLFPTYVEKRYRDAASGAHTALLVRTILAFVVLAGLIPALSLAMQRSWELPPRNAALQLARYSMVFMTIGAMCIGLSTIFPDLIAAIVINTLGVGTDLTLLSFLATLIQKSYMGRMFMVIASSESAGSLLGNWLIPVVYRWGFADSSRDPGTVYYVCAAFYVLAGAGIWCLRP